jgi:hypothetical protein
MAKGSEACSNHRNRCMHLVSAISAHLFLIVYSMLCVVMLGCVHVTAQRHALLRKKIVYKPVTPDWVACQVKNLHVGEHMSTPPLLLYIVGAHTCFASVTVDNLKEYLKVHSIPVSNLKKVDLLKCVQAHINGHDPMVPHSLCSSHVETCS